MSHSFGITFYGFGSKFQVFLQVISLRWKSKDEILFFLDGKLVKNVVPPADFNIEMYLRLVVETYDWNPVPADGGMTGSKEDRTRSYNWVRTWKLVD